MDKCVLVWKNLPLFIKSDQIHHKKSVQDQSLTQSQLNIPEPTQSL